MPNIPPHILKANELKQAIDEKANVIEMDDEADRDQRFIEPDSFEACPDDSFNEEDDGEGVLLATTDEPRLDEDSPVTDGSVAGASAASSHVQAERVPGFARIALGSLKPRYTTSNTAASKCPAPEEQPAVQGRLLGKRTDKKTKSKYANFSNRLGGGFLTEFRDTIGAKRALEEDKGMLEASYTKAKRIRAEKATTALKTKLAGLENAANSMGESFMETILLLREENKRKEEDRRAEEEQRRRDDIAAREARLLADKSDAEERRRQDKIDMEERARRDRDEARARTQELMLMIQAITKKS
ncbi:hypothetical protein PR001_g13923 [Phytophthora rubi]|uniref:Uncharacterized protein n=1 Tax=Phytophthora rubi TaxID=129364 RepID=A0A6A3LTW4_9STRA|nr:hypothetical protein PR001_g13923 [Phytophthora rubi]KAE9045947.1 hypothetical protein PR002_g1957 [Phytophthora rubi]